MPTPQNSQSPIIQTTASPTMVGGGSFVVGTQSSFFFYFNDINGILYDPTDMSVSITDPDGDDISDLENADSLDKLETGIFAFLWNIPTTAITGKYLLTLNYTVDTIDGPVNEVHQEYFLVTESGPGAFTVRQVVGRAFLESLIGEIQRIPVYNETGRFNKDRTICEFSFSKWNHSAGVRVYINGEKQESGFTADFFKGRIHFSKKLSKYDEITADYNFRWFMDEELDSFIEQGVNIVNIYPPQSVYNINNIPDRWFIAAEYGAAISVYRRWMSDTLLQKPAKVFGGMERAQQVFGNLETLKKNYEEMLYKMLDMKKYQPYVGLTRTITHPEFTLPGGRSRWLRYMFKSA